MDSSILVEAQYGILEIRPRIHHRATEDTEKFKSFICPDEASGQMKDLSLPVAKDFD
jgi:hypothetical protein